MKFSLLLTASLLPLSLLAKGPSNDNFAKAKVIPPKLPAYYLKGSLTDSLDRFRATLEEGEPKHVGQEGGGSVWYTWTPAADQRVKLIVESKEVDILLAVYTGHSVNDLSLVHRYKNMAFPASSRKRTEPFSPHTRVEFLAKAGTKYYIAVANENDVFKRFNLSIFPSPNPFFPKFVAIEAGSQWEFLLATDDEENPVDPKSLDSDFYHTWMFPRRYDGPEFLKGRGPFGYGAIKAFQVRANLLGKRGSEPPKGKRYTSYLRTRFTPFTDITRLGIEGIFDDGIIFYINGRESLRLNITADKNPQDWMTLATSKKVEEKYDTERFIQFGTIDNLNLAADVPVELSVSLHNHTADDDDLAMDLRIFALFPEGKAE